MRKVEIKIPNLYLTEQRKQEVQKRGVEVATKFSRQIHKNDERLNHTISRDDTIYR